MDDLAPARKTRGRVGRPASTPHKGGPRDAIELPGEHPPLTPRERRFVALLAFGDPQIDEEDRPKFMSLSVSEAGRRCGWGITRSYQVLRLPQVQTELALLQRSASVEAGSIAAQAIPQIMRRLIAIMDNPTREDGPAVKAAEVLLRVSGIKPPEREAPGVASPLEPYSDEQIMDGLRAVIGQINVQVNVQKGE